MPGAGWGGGRGGDAYYLFFFYYVKLMNSNYPEVGVPTPYNLISRSAHVSCLTEYMYHIKSKVINYGLARTQRTKERGLHWQEDWHICILSIQSVCLYITPPFFFFFRENPTYIMYMILMLNLKTYVTFWELLLIETLTISIRIKIKMKLNIAVLSVKLYR